MTQTAIDFDAARDYPDTVVDRMINTIVDFNPASLTEANDEDLDIVRETLHSEIMSVPIELRAFVYRAFTERLIDFGFDNTHIAILNRGNA